MRKTILFLILVSALRSPVLARTRQDVDNTPDPVASLREQIEAAPNAPNEIVCN